MKDFVSFLLTFMVVFNFIDFSLSQSSSDNPDKGKNPYRRLAPYETYLNSQSGPPNVDQPLPEESSSRRKKPKIPKQRIFHGANLNFVPILPKPPVSHPQIQYPNPFFNFPGQSHSVSEVPRHNINLNLPPVPDNEFYQPIVRPPSPEYRPRNTFNEGGSSGPGYYPGK